MTNFPGSNDSFTSFLDITAADGPLIKQYLEAMNVGDQVTATQILSQIPASTQKVIKATDINKLSQAMLALERFWNGDIKSYITQLQAEWLAYVNQFEYLGNWSASKTYFKNNLVSYIVDGVTLVYMALSNPPQGARPTNAVYWQVLTVQGVEGPSGAGLSFRGYWSSAYDYTIDDAVVYNNAIWRALKTSNNVIPGTDSSTWSKIVTSGVTTYPIQATEPTNQNDGEIWFDTSSNPTGYYKLKTLSNPATAAQIKSGYRAYDANGNVILGTA